MNGAPDVLAMEAACQAPQGTYGEPELYQILLTKAERHAIYSSSVSALSAMDTDLLEGRTTLLCLRRLTTPGKMRGSAASK